MYLIKKFIGSTLFSQKKNKHYSIDNISENKKKQFQFSCTFFLGGGVFFILMVLFAMALFFLHPNHPGSSFSMPMSPRVAAFCF